MQIKIFIFFTLVIIKISSAQTNNADLIIGDWEDLKKEVLIRCYKENGKYYAKTLWVENLNDRGKPLPDNEKNWINMVVMKNFVYDKNEWNGGTIYVPKTEKTYTAYVKLISTNILKVTGFVWFRFLSESQLFTRVYKSKKS